jgi:uncharacterized protein YjbI with pentapeptide repeats
MQSPSPRVIALIVVGIVLLTGAVVVVLWWAGTRGLDGKDLVTARFDALRVGLSIGVGSGGVFALYLAWRRQQSTEVGLRQKDRDQADVARAYLLQEQMAETTKADAADRRITELYSKSVEQLGSDKAPVRLGGLYALERLGQTVQEQRETIGNLLCAYLRMEYTPPSELPNEPTHEQRDRYNQLIQQHSQEHEVRQTALDIIIRHHDPGRPDQHWQELRVRLQRANLTVANLARANLTDANLTRSNLTGANLTRANLTGADLYHANLYRANLAGANLTDANLTIAKLTRSNLTGADLTVADLTHADMTDADMNSTILNSANLTDANLTNANLTNADLYHANLTGAKLTRANLTGANLTNADMNSANLTNAELTGVLGLDGPAQEQSSAEQQV